MVEREIKWVAAPLPSDKRKPVIPKMAEVVLKGVADNAYISKHLASVGSLETTPLSELITVHNRLADFNDSIEKLSDKSTGAELKSALSKHDFETQIELLAGYIQLKKAEIAKVEPLWGAKDRRSQNLEFEGIDKRQNPTPEELEKQEAKKEQIRIKRTGRRIFNNGLIIIVAIVAIIITLLLTSTTTGKDTSVLKSVLDAVLAVMKVIFG